MHGAQSEYPTRCGCGLWCGRVAGILGGDGGQDLLLLDATPLNAGLCLSEQEDKAQQLEHRAPNK